MKSMNYKDWSDYWLGKRVRFSICGKVFTGEIEMTERILLCNGIHDILTIEVDDPSKQVKVQVHRQACKLLEAT